MASSARSRTTRRRRCSAWSSRRKTLPPDVGAAAAALARAGRLREALSLLYRGALSELVHRRGVRLLASHTEGDVLRLSGEMPYLREPD